MKPATLIRQERPRRSATAAPGPRAGDDARAPLPWTDAAGTPGADEIMQVALACALRARQLLNWCVALFAGVAFGIDHIEVGVWAYGSGGPAWKGVDGWLHTDWRRGMAAIIRTAAALAVRIEDEAHKRLAAGDVTPIRIAGVVKHVAMTVDDDAVSDEVAKQAVALPEVVASVSAPTDVAPTGTGVLSFWGG